MITYSVYCMREEKKTIFERKCNIRDILFNINKSEAM